MKSYQCSHCGKPFQAEAGYTDQTIPCPHCKQLLVIPSSVFPPGTMFGGFKIISKIGEGGMGNVYIAEQLSMGRKVALKVLAKEYSTDENIIKQFKKEVQLSGRLNHPYIVKAIDAGEEGGHYYMATVFIDGEDCEKILSRQRKKPEQEALSIIVKTAEILAYAWEKHNLLHRDIKPGNIMISKKGEVFLLDLGIAQSFDFRRKKSSEEQVLGSPFYMSPEQARGEHLDWRTDLYSLGATLYHMIAGFPPFDAEKVETIVEMHVHTPFPDPNQKDLSLKLSSAIVALLSKMLAKKPEDRFESWQKFIYTAKNLYEKPSQPQTKKTIISTRIPTIARSKSEPISYIHILVLISGLVTLFLAGYVIHQINKNKLALRSINKAETYLVSCKNDYEAALPLFQEAYAFSKNTAHEETAKRRLNEIKTCIEEMKEKIKYFDKKLAEAETIMNQKHYEQAIKILESIKDIEDPPRRRTVEGLIVELNKKIKK